MSSYLVAEAVRAGRETGRVRAETRVKWGQVVRRLASALALSRRFAAVRVRMVEGLKIRVSAVRFRPWPLANSTTTYAASRGPRRATSLGDSLGDSRAAGAASRADVWQSRAIYDVWRAL